MTPNQVKIGDRYIFRGATVTVTHQDLSVFGENAAEPGDTLFRISGGPENFAFASELSPITDEDAEIPAPLRRDLGL